MLPAVLATVEPLRVMVAAVTWKLPVRFTLPVAVTELLPAPTVRPNVPPDALDTAPLSVTGALLVVIVLVGAAVWILAALNATAPSMVTDPLRIAVAALTI